MSFKQRLVVFGICFIAALIAVPMLLPWMGHWDAIGAFSFLVEYPALLILLLGFLIAGLVADKMD